MWWCWISPDDNPDLTDHLSASKVSVFLLALVSGASRDDEGDVVVLLVGAEELDLVDDGGEDGLRRESGASLERGDEAVFAELFLGLVEGFGDTVGVEGEEVAGGELALDGGGMPLLEHAEDGCGGVEALDLAAAAEEDGT